MHYTYSENAVQGALIPLDAEESRHLCQVLRMEAGDKLGLIDGRGRLFEAEISVADKRHASLKVNGVLREETVRPLAQLAVAPTKNASRMEWLVEKATEMGLGQLFFIQTEHTERSKMRMDRIERVKQSAVKQSISLFAPEIHAPQDFKDWIEKDHSHKRFIAVVREGLPLLRDQLQKGQEALVLIGPEGDFSQEEVEIAESKGFLPVSLGEKRLRVETAALAACFTINLVNQ